jgi:hypothetical protein
MIALAAGHIPNFVKIVGDTAALFTAPAVLHSRG